MRCQEDVEADVRLLMFKHCAIEPRGFDSVHERGVLHARIDKLLDEHSLMAALETLAARP